MKALNMLLDQIPSDAPDFVRTLQPDHAYSRVLTDFCAVHEVPTLSELLAAGAGRLFASVETTCPAADVYDAPRVDVPLRPKGDVAQKVLLRLGTEHIYADTTRGELERGSEMAMVAQLREADGDTLIFEPMLLGGPMVQPASDVQIPDAIWLGFAFGSCLSRT